MTSVSGRAGATGGVCGAGGGAGGGWAGGRPRDRARFAGGPPSRSLLAYNLGVTSETTRPAGAAPPADEGRRSTGSTGRSSPPAPPTAPQAQNGALLGRLSLPTAGARILLEQLERIEAHEQGAGWAGPPEDVHRMRVATRACARGRVFRDALGEVIDLERANEELKSLAPCWGGPETWTSSSAPCAGSRTAPRPTARPSRPWSPTYRSRKRPPRRSSSGPWTRGP